MSPNCGYRLVWLALFAELYSCQLESAEAPADVVHYRKLFNLRRAERLDAVKTILGLNDHEKQSKLVAVVAHKMSEVLTKSKLTLERSGYIPGAEFPKDEIVRDALSQVLENTAFMGEIVLRLPDVVHRVLAADRSIALTLYWAVGFSNSTGVYDAKGTKLIHLMAQELGLVEKDRDYHNPYTKQAKAKEPRPPAPEKKEKPPKKKLKIPRGPRLSSPRHAEL